MAVDLKAVSCGRRFLVGKLTVELHLYHHVLMIMIDQFDRNNGSTSYQM